MAKWPAWQKNKTAGISWDRVARLNQIWADDGGECYADASCKAAMPEGEAFKCGTVDVLYRHIKTPLFVLENQYDEEQIFGELGVPAPNGPQGVVLIAEYLKYFGRRMRKSLSQIAAPNGLWNPACLDHCDTFYPSIMTVNISGVDATEAVGSWYRQNGSGSKHIWQDTCGEGLVGMPCNKGCPLPV